MPKVGLTAAPLSWHEMAQQDHCSECGRAARIAQFLRQSILRVPCKQRPKMNQPQKLQAIITQLRTAEAKMKEGDHISFTVLCLLIFFFALLYFIEGHFLIFTVLSSCLGLAILLYYWITASQNRSSWYWEPVGREIEGKDLHQMWNTSDRDDWLLWFCAHMIGKPGWPTHQQVVLASCQCARLALKHIKPGETRPLKAI